MKHSGIDKVAGANKSDKKLSFSQIATGVTRMMNDRKIAIPQTLSQ